MLVCIPIRDKFLDEKDDDQCDEDAERGARNNIGRIVHAQIHARKRDERGEDPSPGFPAPVQKGEAQDRGSAKAARGVPRWQRIATGRGDDQRQCRVLYEGARASDDVLENLVADEPRASQRYEHGDAPDAVFLRADQNDGNDDPDCAMVAELGDEREHRIKERVGKSRLHPM